MFNAYLPRSPFSPLPDACYRGHGDAPSGLSFDDQSEELRRRALRLLGEMFDGIQALPDGDMASWGHPEWLDALAVGLLNDADEAEEVIRNLAMVVRVRVVPVRARSAVAPGGRT